MEYDDTAPDPDLSPKEQELVGRLSQAEVMRVDQELLTNCTHQWRKVAMVVGTTMGSLESRTIGIPAIYYAQRVAKLVREGRLESQGDLQRMRYSEVRLPSK
jgi:ubiquinone biosynthesis protein UbiJ